MIVIAASGKLHDMDDRIDALLSDMEAMHSAQQRHARRGELGDEVAAHAAELTLRERLRGAIGQTVQVLIGDREISGTAVFLGDGILVISGAEIAIIAVAHIRVIRTRSTRHRDEAGSLERLGMGSALRRLAADHEEIAVELTGDGGVVRGRSEMIAADYVEIAGRIIPFGSIAVVRARVNPFG